MQKGGNCVLEVVHKVKRNFKIYTCNVLPLCLALYVNFIFWSFNLWFLEKGFVNLESGLVLIRN
jgi:hypothetical protein